MIKSKSYDFINSIQSSITFEVMMMMMILSVVFLKNKVSKNFHVKFFFQFFVPNNEKLLLLDYNQICLIVFRLLGIM